MAAEFLHLLQEFRTELLILELLQVGQLPPGGRLVKNKALATREELAEAFPELVVVLGLGAAACGVRGLAARSPGLGCC